MQADDAFAFFSAQAQACAATLACFRGGGDLIGGQARSPAAAAALAGGHYRRRRRGGNGGDIRPLEGTVCGMRLACLFQDRYPGDQCRRRSIAYEDER
ncbi:hypothetical protein [Methylomonas koyamae]|uniref:Uncharacterized protein n=1 Tax=Methylomonas koyamae TaxID=702114 RepID=A0A291IMP9_9GAMM|nr:hypothetical protein [Methylomonas koyamae]ATG91491.1 hypothetical protein MKLM6_3301 [Methylomonas koyamae]OAI26879.1 hypothetical protein A1356_10735 [Methylomonas koyamae]